MNLINTTTNGAGADTVSTGVSTAKRAPRAASHRGARAHLERARKVANKLGWEARAAAGAAPRVHTITRSDEEWAASCEEPAFIDPVHGFVVTERGVLLEQSLEPNFDHPKAPWRLGTPSPFGPVPAMAGPSPRIVEYPCVISLRHRWEYNYYHFFLDVLGKLDLVDRLGLDRDTPIVLGRYAREMGFVKEVLSTGALADRRWVVPDLDNRLIVRAERTVYCRTNRPFAARIEHLLSEMDVALPDQGATDRIFLTRNAPATRRLINEDETLPILRRFGFRTVDTASMSMQEQIATFTNARYVVALHGAGITNIIFRRGAPLDLLEMHPNTYPGPGDMQRICKEMGYTHSALAGMSDGGPPQQANFRVDPAQLHDAIDRMLSTRPAFAGPHESHRAASLAPSG